MQLQTLSYPQFVSLNNNSFPSISPSYNNLADQSFSSFTCSNSKFTLTSREIKLDSRPMSSVSAISNHRENVVGLGLGLEDSELEGYAIVANKLADAAGEVIRQYFRKSFDILDKEDLSEFFFFFFLAAKYLVWKFKFLSFYFFCGI